MKLKRPTTHEEQIQILKAKGLVIEDTKDAKNFLERTNYYRLSAFGEPFRENGKGQFLPGTTFNQIRYVYMFDQKIRAILFEMVEDIEFELRTQIAYYHGNKYGAEGYLDVANFGKQHDEKSFNHHLKNIIRENKESIVIQHHNSKYEGKFPIWVIIEFFTMGMVSKFYKDMHHDDKTHIAKQYSTTAECLENWIRCVTVVRNRCAHYSRFYDWTFSTTPVFNEKKLPPGENKLFGQLLVLRNMYPDAKEWNNELLKRLERAVSRYSPYIRFEHLGFPKDWNVWLRK